MLSKRVKALKPSLTLKISAKAKQMKKQGIPVIDFSVGEPDFPTVMSAKAAGKKAIDDDFTRYTQTDGIPELKEAILSRFHEDDGLDFKPSEVIVSPGAKASIFLALASIAEKDDEVIVPAPYWVSYPEQVKLVGAEPIIVETSEKDGFMLSPRMLQSHVTMNTKAIILNHPSNPSGTTYPEEKLKALLEFADRYNLYVISDEVYSKIIYDGFKYVRAVKCVPELRSRIITIDGVSKSYSMTGWRIGYALGPEEIIAGMKSIQDHLTSNPCSIAQKAAVEALRGSQEEVNERQRIFCERRDFLFEHLNGIPGIHCHKPQGAFYLFPDVSHYFGMSDGSYVINDAFGLSTYLLEKAYVATVPGEGFGAPNYIRLSFATSMDNIKNGIKEMINALGKLGKV